MKWENIRTSKDIIEYSRSKGCDFFSKDRMQEHKTELFGGVTMFRNYLLFKMRELQIVSGRKSTKYTFKLGSLNTEGQVSIIQNFSKKEELQKMFNSYKIIIK